MTVRIELAAWLTTLLGILSPLLTIGRTVPQGARILRSGAEGVSTATWMLVLLLAELWAIYGFLARIPAEIATNLPNGLLCVAVLALVARNRGSARRMALTGTGLSALVAAFTAACMLARADGVEIGVAVAGSLALYVPQLWKSLTETELSGLSPTSWLFAFLAAVSWGAYGLAIGKLPVSLPSVVMIPMSLVIVARASSYQLRATRRRAAHPAGTAPG